MRDAMAQHRRSPGRPESWINLEDLVRFVNDGRLQPGTPDRPMTMADLAASGALPSSRVKRGVKLLAGGLSSGLDVPPLYVEFSRASAGAIKAIEGSGGEVTCAYYDRVGMQHLLYPDKRVIPPRRARPPPALMPYFLDYEKRGYLSPEIQRRDQERRR